MDRHSISGIAHFIKRAGPMLEGSSQVITLDYDPSVAAPPPPRERQRWLSAVLVSLVSAYFGHMHGRLAASNLAAAVGSEDVALPGASRRASNYFHGARRRTAGVQ